MLWRVKRQHKIGHVKNCKAISNFNTFSIAILVGRGEFDDLCYAFLAAYWDAKVFEH